MVLSADEYSSRRFTRVFVTILILGIGMTAALALYVDPFGTFGTGRIPPLLTNEREDKPKAFLALDPSPQAIVIGSSRVMKLNPACVRELTGIPAFNFGLGNAHMEDLVAVVRFYQARSRAPLRELIIGLDVEMFDNKEVDQRTLSSRSLAPYVGGDASLSWSTASRALFGMQAFEAAFTSIRHHMHPAGASHRTTGPDGLLTYPDWEGELRNGTFRQAPHLTEIAERLKNEENDFTKLSAPRVAMFLDLVRSVHQAGTTIDVYIPPLHPAVLAAWAKSPLAARTLNVDEMLRDLEREGVIRYLKVNRVEDFGGDQAAYFDGIHMMESNTSRLLLKMFHREHGCGQ